MTIDTMVNNLISVIMPVYNPNLEQLEISLQSVLAQTYSNLELIIIYKSSGKEVDSKVQEIFEKYKDNRIRIFHDNSGFVSALNLGIEKSNGKFIGRMDSDDICVNTRFEEQSKFMQQNKLSLVGSWAFSITNEGKQIGTIEPPYEHDKIRKKIMFHNPILHPTILVEKKMLEDIGYYNEKFYGAEDYELYLRAISKNYKIGNIPRYLIYLREAESSITRGNQWRSTRKAYFKTKKQALFHYGFNRYYDVFYYLLTPLTFLISPKMSLAIKNIAGWNKN